MCTTTQPVYDLQYRIYYYKKTYSIVLNVWESDLGCRCKLDPQQGKNLAHCQLCLDHLMDATNTERKVMH